VETSAEAGKYKQIILDSLKFLVEQKRVKVYGFVIMINHVHIIWHIHPAAAIHPSQSCRQEMEFN
jgi:REP element-mobilizing transposase RayT